VEIWDTFAGSDCTTQNRSPNSFLSENCLKNHQISSICLVVVVNNYFLGINNNNLYAHYEKKFTKLVSISKKLRFYVFGVVRIY
jgi:hypothetical protein